MKILNKKTSLVLLLLCSFSAGALSLMAYTVATKKQSDSDANTTQEQPRTSCNYNINRLSGYKYIQPLLSAEPDCQSEKLNGLKMQISDLIEREKASGSLVSASAYFEDLKDNSWTDINGNEGYHPASLIKVVTLIAYLKMAENTPGLMDKEVYCDKNAMKIPAQSYTSKSIESGKKYTIRDLLEYMIAYSDNYATSLLNANLNTDVFIKVFTDFGLPIPNLQDRGFSISNTDYSRFMKALYNASYLSIPASEYATSLLCKCDFNKGITTGIPSSTRIAHKFGESKVGQYRELHESAIIYLDNGQYLLTVMTKGEDMNKLSAVLGQVSKLAYDRMAAEKTAL
jgi:beta-lactamase class A